MSEKKLIWKGVDLGNGRRDGVLLTGSATIRPGEVVKKGLLDDEVVTAHKADGNIELGVPEADKLAQDKANTQQANTEAAEAAQKQKAEQAGVRFTDAKNALVMATETLVSAEGKSTDMHDKWQEAIKAKGVAVDAVNGKTGKDKAEAEKTVKTAESAEETADKASKAASDAVQDAKATKTSAVAEYEAAKATVEAIG